jgi:hypothetical protein
MKKILLPTDFSKDSDEVIAFALEAFNNEPCEFYFLHTYPYNPVGLDALSILQERAEYFKKVDMDIFIKMVGQVNYFACKKAYSKHAFKLLCKNSGLIEGVAQAVDRLCIDLIIMGTKGKNKTSRHYKEKKINQVVTQIKSCPVMAIPLNGEAWACMGLNDIKIAD